MKNFKQLKAHLPFLLGAILCFLAALVALNPTLRNWARKPFLKPYRKVLSTVSGQIKPQGQQIKVVKIKTHQGIALEIYLKDKKTSFHKLKEKKSLLDRQDAYFHFRGEATNLALDDINGDHHLDILAPTFDEDLMAHLNVFTYNPKTKQFERAQPRPISSP